MKPQILTLDRGVEVYTPERCYITELANTPDDPAASVALARVVPGVTTRWHRLIDTIDSSTAQAGDKFHATLDAPIAIDGDVVVPAHYDVQGHVVNAQASGKFAGQALLALQLDRIKVGDRTYDIQTDQFSQKTNSRGKNTAEKVGAGFGPGRYRSYSSDRRWRWMGTSPVRWRDNHKAPSRPRGFSD